VRACPKSTLAPSAQYWIGNAHFARRDYRAAINAQRTLIANYSDSNKVPDALLNIASAQSELGDSAGARRTHEEIVAKHPQSEAAAKAKQRLTGRS
jgi:tol-pal system protein YbgF